MSNTNCKYFCQCAPLRTNSDGSVDYYWQKQPCGAGTLWNTAINVCDHAYNVDENCVGKLYLTVLFSPFRLQISYSHHIAYFIYLPIKR